MKAKLQIRKIHRPTPRTLIERERPAFIQITDRPITTLATTIKPRPSLTTPRVVYTTPLIIPAELTSRNPYAQAENLLLLRKQASLEGLLGCCQSQVPGCRHLCSPHVTKEDVILYSSCFIIISRSRMRCTRGLAPRYRWHPCWNVLANSMTPSPSENAVNDLTAISSTRINYLLNVWIFAHRISEYHGNICPV